MNEQQYVEQYVKMHGPVVGAPSSQPNKGPLGDPDPKLGVNTTYVFKDGSAVTISTTPDGSAYQSAYHPSADFLNGIQGQGQGRAPTIIQSDPNKKDLVFWDPQNGITTQPNPGYDPATAQRAAEDQSMQRGTYEMAKDRAARERADSEYNQRVKAWEAEFAARKAQADELRNKLLIDIQLHGADSEDAKQRYQRWVDENIIQPFKAMEELRARTQEQQHVEMEQRRRLEQSAADDVNRAEFGYKAGQDAVQTEKDMLKYAVGPEFAGQFAGALNNLSQGKSFSGWTPGAFTIQRPDFQGAADAAVARALQMWSPYAQRIMAAQAAGAAGQPIPSTDYSSVNGGAVMPTTSPPPMAPPLNVGPYNPPSTVPPTPYPAPPNYGPTPAVYQPDWGPYHPPVPVTPTTGEGGW